MRARDPFTGGHTDTHVTIKVTDVNDNPPKFTRSSFKGEVSEAAAVGHVILQVSCIPYSRSAEIGRYGCGMYAVGYVI